MADQIRFKPQNGDTSINIPAQMDLRQKTIQTDNNKRLMVFVFILGWLVLMGLLLWKVFLTPVRRILTVLIGSWLMMRVIRFVIYDEASVSDSFEYLLKNDYQVFPDVYWGTYEIDNKSPYVVSYNTGLKGIFVEFHKDVVVGKGPEARYAHYAGIEQMYRTALARGIMMVSLDLMSDINRNVDLSDMHKFSENSDIKSLETLMARVISFTENRLKGLNDRADIILFLTRGNKTELMEVVRDIIHVSTQANYHAATYLDRRQIQELAKTLYNLEAFSINEALRDSLHADETMTIKAVELLDASGNIKEKYSKWSWELAGAQDKTKGKSRKDVAVQEQPSQLTSQGTFEATPSQFINAFEDSRSALVSEDLTNEQFNPELLQEGTYATPISTNINKPKVQHTKPTMQNVERAMPKQAPKVQGQKHRVQEPTTHSNTSQRITNTSISPKSKGITNTGMIPKSKGITNTGMSPKSQGITNTGVSHKSQGITNTGMNPKSQGITNTGVSSKSRGIRKGDN